MKKAPLAAVFFFLNGMKTLDGAICGKNITFTGRK